MTNQLTAVVLARAPSKTANPLFAARVAHAAIARLARLPGSRWRNSCLFRSVAECLVLRDAGLPARVVIGVGMEGERADVIAHAWVECEGVRCICTRGDAELEAMSIKARRDVTPARM